MIALCPTHHGLANGGRWIDDQLKEMKQHPFIDSTEISGVYGYLRPDFVCIAGAVAGISQNITIRIVGCCIY